MVIERLAGAPPGLQQLVHRYAGENGKLRTELWTQWRTNHAEHCQDDWPHDGECHWPLPEVLGGRPRARGVDLGAGGLKGGK